MNESTVATPSLRRNRKVLGSSGETPPPKLKATTSTSVSEKLSKKFVSFALADKFETPTKDQSYHSLSDSNISPRNNLDGLSEMHFVNRQKESMKLYESLVAQLNDQKSYMPLLSQLYGSGKSSLVRNFRRVLDTNTSIVRYNVIDNALLVHVQFDGSSEPKNEKHILTALYQEICLTLSRQKMDKFMSLIQLLINQCQGSLKYFLQQYNSNEHLPPLLICFDEIQTLELNGDIIGSARNLLNLWEILIGALVASTRRKTFFVLVGRTQTLVLLGRKVRVPELQHLPPSPSSSRHIILRALSSNHIQESISKTMIDNQSLLQVFYQRGLQSDDVSYFCKRLYFYTGGIPRLVYRVCWSIYNKTTIRLHSMREIDDLFLNKTDLFFTLKYSEEIRLLSSIDGPLGRVLSFVYSLSSLGVTFPDGTPIETYKTMTELLHELPLYIEDVEDSDDPEHVVYRMIFPECLQVNIPSSNPSHSGLLKGLQKHSAILNAGELLEYLTANVLILRILMMKQVKRDICWKDILPCFAYSENVGNMLVDVNLSEMVFLPKCISKKVTLTKEKKEELKTLSWSHDVSVDDWLWIITNMCKVKHFHKPKPMSMSCDLYFLATNDTMVGYAIKNYGQGSSFSVKMLQNEIDKAALSMNRTPIQKFTLFVLCRTHDVLGGLFTSADIFRMEAGRFKWNRKTFEKDETNTTNVSFTEMKKRLRSEIDFFPGTIAIPRGMEVIILGERAFTQFFGEKTTSALKQISEHRTIQRSSFSILCEVVESVGMIPEANQVPDHASSINRRVFIIEDPEGHLVTIFGDTLSMLKKNLAERWEREVVDILAIRYTLGEYQIYLKIDDDLNRVANNTKLTITWR